MITRKTEILLGLYKTEKERYEEKEVYKSQGYRILEEGAASFGKEDVSGTDIKAGEICLFVKYIK